MSDVFFDDFSRFPGIFQLKAAILLDLFRFAGFFVAIIRQIGRLSLSCNRVGARVAKGDGL
jgi:hypothetical protein